MEVETLYNWPITLIFMMMVVSVLASIWCIFDQDETYWENHQKWFIWFLAIVSTAFIIWVYFDPDLNWTRTEIIEKL